MSNAITENPTADTATLMPHPRLYIGEKELERANHTDGAPLLQKASQRAAKVAQAAVEEGPRFEFPRLHNSLLIRARIMQNRVVSSLLRWQQTGEAKYREAAITHVMHMDQWEYWSWLTWRQGNPDPNAIFDLAYGENSATLAIAYTWLYATLSQEQAKAMRELAMRRSLTPFLVVTDPNAEQKPWWYRHADTNWNSVCVGGAGMLALAMYEDLDEAGEVVRRAEQSIEPFMKELNKTDGGWPEGIGYWNYGMRYALMYLLSHERATGTTHPLLEQPTTAKTLAFPLDFCPHGVGCSFGDVNKWSPLPFHYATAQRLGQGALVARLDQRLAQALESSNQDRGRGGNYDLWPSNAEMVLLHPRPEEKITGKDEDAGEEAPDGPKMRHYTGLDWVMMADRWPDSTLYASVRGGTTQIPHSYRDLMSVNMVVGDERLVRNAEEGEYLDSTFGKRRKELFEDQPHSKNTLLINGVGIGVATITTTTHPLKGMNVVRLISDANAKQRDEDNPQRLFIGRLVMLIREPRLLVVLDRVTLPHQGRVEARWFSGFKPTQGEGTAVRWDGERETLHGGFAASVPAGLYHAVSAPTSPDIVPASHMLRWCTHGLNTDVVLAHAFSPQGPVSPTLEVSEKQAGVTIENAGNTQRILVDPETFTPGDLMNG